MSRIVAILSVGPLLPFLGHYPASRMLAKEMVGTKGLEGPVAGYERSGEDAAILEQCVRWVTAMVCRATAGRVLWALWPQDGVGLGDVL